MAKVIKTPVIRDQSRLLHKDDKAIQSSQAVNAVSTDMNGIISELANKPETIVDDVANTHVDTVTRPEISTHADDVFHDALRMANEKLEKTESELQEYKTQIEQLKSEAIAKSYKEGYSQGISEAKDVASKKIALLSDVCADVTKKYECFFDDAEDDIVEIIYQSVCKILCDSSLDSKSILPIVKHLAGKVISVTNIINVHVSSFDYDDLILKQEDINNNGVHRINFISDDRIESGGCILESETGNIDARLDVQLQKFKEVLMDARRFNPTNHSTS